MWILLRFTPIDEPTIMHIELQAKYFFGEKERS